MEVLFESAVYATAGWFIGKAIHGDAYTQMDYLVASLGVVALVGETVLLLFT